MLDTSVLARLAADVDNPPFVTGFAQKYRSLLAQRVERITTAVARGDEIAAMEAALSLKVSSTTVGTRELAELALHIEDEVRRGDLSAAERKAGKLADAVQRADRALEAYLQQALPG